MSFTFLTPKGLSERIPYSTRHIRDYLKDRVFIEGYHYVRTPGGRRILFIWERIESDLVATQSIPLSAGGSIHG